MSTLINIGNNDNVFCSPKLLMLKYEDLDTLLTVNCSLQNEIGTLQRLDNTRFSAKLPDFLFAFTFH